jgi:hypothetical protein
MTINNKYNLTARNKDTQELIFITVSAKNSDMAIIKAIKMLDKKFGTTWIYPSCNSNKLWITQ